MYYTSVKDLFSMLLDRTSLRKHVVYKCAECESGTIAIHGPLDGERFKELKNLNLNSNFLAVELYTGMICF